MPRKMSGIAISMIDASIVARSTPSVVFESATHLYPSSARSTLSLAFPPNTPGRLRSLPV